MQAAGVSPEGLQGCPTSIMCFSRAAGAERSMAGHHSCEAQEGSSSAVGCVDLSEEPGIQIQAGALAGSELSEAAVGFVSAAAVHTATCRLQKDHPEDFQNWQGYRAGFHMQPAVVGHNHFQEQMP
jgi:hypothetical protein